MINADLPIEQYTDGVRKIIETQTTDIGLFKKTIRDDFITVQDLNDALIILEPYEKTSTKINCINNEILRRSGNGSVIEIPDYMEPKRDISTIYDLSEKARYAAQASMNNYLHPNKSFRCVISDPEITDEDLKELCKYFQRVKKSGRKVEMIISEYNIRTSDPPSRIPNYMWDEWRKINEFVKLRKAKKG